jgi:hypothetical protein
MKDTMSLVLATAILAVGGVGLYMFKSPDDEQKGGREEYNEDTLFGSGSFWGSSNKSDDDVVEEDYDDSSFHEPKVRSRGSKTKRSRKTSGTKRRYY